MPTTRGSKKKATAATMGTPAETSAAAAETSGRVLTFKDAVDQIMKQAKTDGLKPTTPKKYTDRFGQLIRFTRQLPWSDAKQKKKSTETVDKTNLVAFLSETEDVISAIEGHYNKPETLASNRKSMFTAIQSCIKHSTLKDLLSDSVKKVYSKQQEKYKEEANSKAMDNASKAISKKTPEGKFVEWTDIIEAFKKSLADDITSEQTLTLMLYIMMPVRRLSDYSTIKIYRNVKTFEKAIKPENVAKSENKNKVLITANDCRFFIGDYKTITNTSDRNRYQYYEVKFSKTSKNGLQEYYDVLKQNNQPIDEIYSDKHLGLVCDILNKNYEQHNRVFLFQYEKGDELVPITENSLGTYLSNIFGSLLGVRIGLLDLRHLFATYIKRTLHLTGNELESLSYQMGTSTNMLNMYQDVRRVVEEEVEEVSDDLPDLPDDDTPEPAREPSPKPEPEPEPEPEPATEPETPVEPEPEPAAEPATAPVVVQRGRVVVNINLTGADFDNEDRMRRIMEFVKALE